MIFHHPTVLQRMHKDVSGSTIWVSWIIGKEQKTSHPCGGLPDMADAIRRRTRVSAEVDMAFSGNALAFPAEQWSGGDLLPFT